MFRTIATLFGATLLAGLAAGPAGAGSVVPPGPFAVADTANVRYGPHSQNVLDECRPRPTADQWQGPYPAIVFIHGGAWGAGDKSYHSASCNSWASYGFVGININYRLLRSDDPSTWWPTQLVDAQAAIRWVRANAAALNVARGQVYALGDSAGGQIAEYVGFWPYSVAGDLASLNGAQSPHVQFVVAESAPSFWGPSLSQPNAPSTSTYQIVSTYARNTALTLLVAGDADTTVVPANSIDLFNKLRALGRPVRFIGFHGSHEFVGTPSSEIASVRKQEITLGMAQAKYFKVMPDSVKGPTLP